MHGIPVQIGVMPTPGSVWHNRLKGSGHEGTFLLRLSDAELKKDRKIDINPLSASLHCWPQCEDIAGTRARYKYSKVNSLGRLGLFRGVS